MGVVLFTLVVGYFPFSAAEEKDSFYNFLTQGEVDCNGINAKYWKTLKGSHLSREFKELMQLIFREDGNKRPTLEQIKEHKWINKEMEDSEITCNKLLEKLGLNTSKIDNEARV